VASPRASVSFFIEASCYPILATASVSFRQQESGAAIFATSRVHEGRFGQGPGAGLTHLPCSRIKSSRRSTAPASGVQAADPGNLEKQKRRTDSRAALRNSKCDRIRLARRVVARHPDAMAVTP
jgi:hypothetical protein